ncbi:hypothetical protein SBF1_3450007 [Candidatus Desulfosporosinus infrequens]|uniref:Uncharacterized protein n=1 Tax=Candidatus Desulfosporosinus infrequens TaxID=2043169 RepID=A0A2U3L2I2_9FIRM|nr:hypothetical protein SBF1_3450007 [Candidatus Desulfosporosinus infrequens]
MHESKQDFMAKNNTLPEMPPMVTAKSEADGGCKQGGPRLLSRFPNSLCKFYVSCCTVKQAVLVNISKKKLLDVPYFNSSA